jgi:hypothetical protein
MNRMPFPRMVKLTLPLTAAFCVMLLFSPANAKVILDEGFESGRLTGDWVYYWEFGDSVNSGWETRPEFVHSGKQSFRLTSMARDGQENGSNIRRFFMPGVDKCYFRWYAKFAEDFDQGNLMHWVIIGGSRVDNKWSCYDSTAGNRPNGKNFFITTLDPWRDWGRNPAPGALQFYSYFPEMKIDRDGVHYYGNMFGPEKPFLVERGTWHCYEVMVKLNKPGSHDGEQAFWVDGKKIYHQTGIRWRDTEDLRLNSLMLDVYVHQSRHDNTCWFDDVKISTEYIGPLKESTKPAPGK